MLFLLQMLNLTTTASTQAATDNMKINERGCVSIKRYLQKQGPGQVWPTGYHLHTPGLEPRPSLGLAQLYAPGSEVLILKLSSPESESCPLRTDGGGACSYLGGQARGGSFCVPGVWDSRG